MRKLLFKLGLYLIDRFYKPLKLQDCIDKGWHNDDPNKDGSWEFLTLMCPKCKNKTIYVEINTDLPCAIGDNVSCTQCNTEYSISYEVFQDYRVHINKV